MNRFLLDMNTIKPFLKWAGGKSSLISEISKRLPNYVYDQDFCLVEPFVGGGAVSLWALSHLPHLKKLIINDYNVDLTNTYKTIRDNPNELIHQISILQQEYDELLDLESKKPYFNKRKEIFNTRESNSITQASLFIFLNKTAFNGLYRVNKNNKFNVPIGSYKKPKFIDLENILAISKKLQNSLILTGDFSQTLEYLPNDMPCLFYLDPPYRPISETSSFTSYSNSNFNDDEQIRLAEFCQKLDELNHGFILSNSDPKNNNKQDNFFDDLYSEFSIDRIIANRTISAKSNGRNAVTELLVSNIR